MQSVHSGKYCKRHGIEKTRWHNNPRLLSGGIWDCPVCANESSAQSRRALVLVGDQQVTRSQAISWWSFYRLRPQDVYELWEAQGRKCMFGGEPLAWEAIHIDHQHGYPGCIQYYSKTDRRVKERACPKESVRGVGCRQHNAQQGLYEADPKGYMAVAKWHVKHNGGNWEDICS